MPSELVGTWESTYFESNGNDVSQQYQMTLLFDEHGDCDQILKKPGGTLTSTLAYSRSKDEKTLTIGSAQYAIDNFDGTSMRLRYVSGTQPAGFISPWTADFMKTQ